VWRVGNGEDINIWSASWVPSNPSRKIITPISNIVYTKVSKLIDPIIDVGMNQCCDPYISTRWM
jgi:hypothetical protein